MKDLGWYWHRLRAMSLAEMVLHARKKLRQRSDARGLPDWTGAALQASAGFPYVPNAEEAPASLHQALIQESKEIAAGRWRAFGHLDLQVDTPPHWHKDYWVGKDLATTASAFRLNHRALPDGADVKLVWELSRWYPLVRLAQASHVLGEAASGQRCIAWLEDWVKENPPGQGWNWTSALEAGIRLIQFTWIDALLRGAAASDARVCERLAALRQAILPPHAYFAWRYRSFGSSANNHLLGELVGLIVATARWPELERWGVSLATLHECWEREVLSQFAGDGGNCEQALNYQLFSFEFCWQARLALRGAGRTVSESVELRLNRAARFFWEVQVSKEPWDYGDSDSAYVTPVFQDDRTVIPEWRGWMDGSPGGATLRYWLGAPPVFHPTLIEGSAPEEARAVGDWWLYPETGIAIHASGDWRMRWDLSPLGYLQTAAHGHLDALHLSLWLKGTAWVVDPGTGAYYADGKLRSWLASRSAHNGPTPLGVPEHPRRLGPFLWQGRHAIPVAMREKGGVVGVLDLPGSQLRRRVTPCDAGSGWQVEDCCLGSDGSPASFTVRWQFAPGATLRVLGPREFIVNRLNSELRVVVGADWDSVEHFERGEPRIGAGSDSLAGTVSSAFRKTERALFLLLTARPTGDKPCVFSTTFLAFITHEN